MKESLQTFVNWIDLHLSRSRVERFNVDFNNTQNEMFILRDDLIHPLASGNKLRKLKFNLIESYRANCSGIVSYGGAFSNHLLACAAISNELSIPMILFVRGEELNNQSNGVLKKCVELGAQLKFLSRKEYKQKKNESGVIKIEEKYFWSIPEGGANCLGVKGCHEIGTLITDFSHILMAVGTGTTFLGIYEELSTHVNFFLNLTVSPNVLSNLPIGLQTPSFDYNRIKIINSEIQEKFGKMNDDVREFSHNHNKKSYIQLDPLYTGSTLYRYLKNYNSSRISKTEQILFVHTGGINQKYW